MSDRLDSYLTQWVRDLAVGHVISDADRKVLDRVALALQNADKHHAQARAAQAIVEAATLFAAIMVDGDVANVPVRDMMRARDHLIAVCFGDQKFKKSAQIVAAYMASREAA